MKINELEKTYSSQEKENIVAYKINEQLIMYEGHLYKKLHQEDLDQYEKEEADPAGLSFK